MTTLHGKHALVTGASRGIGRAIALRLAADGAAIAVHYGRDRDAAEETVRRIAAAGGSAFAMGADIAVPAEIEALFAAIDARMPKIDILVNNAAVNHSAPIEDVTVADFDRTIAINLRGPYFVTQHCLKRMADGGRIVTVSSNAVRIAYPEVSAYGLTKAAMQNLTLSLAKQLGPRGITVNAVVPGVIDTDMNADWLNEDAVRYYAGQTALGRLGTVEEIAGVVAFLASDEGRWVTAQSIEASGGQRL